MQTFQVEVRLPYRKGLAWTPEGRYLAVGAEVFTLLDTAGGPVRFVPEVERPCRGVALVRGGSAVAVGDGSGRITVYDLNGGPKQISGPVRGLDTIAADPSGETIFVAVQRGGKGHIHSFSAHDLTERAAFAPIETIITELAVSADGQRLAGQSWGNKLWLWNVGGSPPQAGAMARVLFDSPEGFALSGDGTFLAAVNGRGLTVWKTVGGEQLFHSGKHRRGVTAVAWSPTRPLLATGDNAGNVFLWDRAGNILTRYDWGLTRVNGLAFAPDGLRCAAFGSTGKVVVWDVDA